MTRIRAVRPDDLEALYAIALATGDGGADASALYHDPRLLGHIYAAPYAVLCPETVFVAEDAEGVGGYIVGAADTGAFDARLESSWWPALRATYPAPATWSRDTWTPDQRRMHAIHHPPRTPPAIVARYPSHLHINLLARLRGRGIGRMLMDRWLRAVRSYGSAGVHLAVGVGNWRATRFYEACGFREPADPASPMPGARWLALSLPRAA